MLKLTIENNRLSSIHQIVIIRRRVDNGAKAAEKFSLYTATTFCRWPCRQALIVILTGLQHNKAISCL